MKTILIIITGSVAAFKSLELIRLLRKSGFRIISALSKGGEAFVTPLSVSSLSGEETFTSDTYKMEHIHLSRKADLIIVCPASANFLNKCASGHGGELALDILLAAPKNVPVIFAPAMNTEMWTQSTTQSSIVKLQVDGGFIVMPSSGTLLCNENGEGKLACVKDIHAYALKLLETQIKLKGKKALITNGATIEKIDDARFISNFSSGLQGAFIAKELQKCGAEIFLVEGNTSHNVVLSKKLFHRFKVLSAHEMHQKVIKILESHQVDYFFSVAAVSDYRIRNFRKGKFPKEDLTSIELELNPDILKAVGFLKSFRPGKVIGFAAEEEENLKANGSKKLRNKNCDIVFANSMCFNEVFTKGIILTKEGEIEAFEGSKEKLAQKLIDFLN